MKIPYKLGVIKSFPDGKEIWINPDYSEWITPDLIRETEERLKISVGDLYETVDINENFPCYWIYLGNGWSLCNIDPARRVCNRYYISPTAHPHYYTGDNTKIPHDIFVAAKSFVDMICEEQPPYEMEA